MAYAFGELQLKLKYDLYVNMTIQLTTYVFLVAVYKTRISVLIRETHFTNEYFYQYCVVWRVKKGQHKNKLVAEMQLSFQTLYFTED